MENRREKATKTVEKAVWRKGLALLSVLLVLTGTGMLWGCGTVPGGTDQSSEQSEENPSSSEDRQNPESEADQTGGDDGQNPESEANQNGMMLTQTEKVGICTDTERREYKDFADFLDAAEPFAITPGFNEKFVSQGMDQSSETGNIYISGYFKTVADNPFSDTENPGAIVVLNSDGEFIAEYVIRNADGTAFTSHMGGVAVSGDTIYVSASQQKEADGTPSYWIASFSLKDLETEGHHEVTVDALYRVPVQPSYLNYSNGVLWVGNFYLKSNDSYQAPVTLGTISGDTDKEEFGSYILGYDLTEKGAERLVPDEGEAFARPDEDKIYATTDMIQGMTMLDDGTIALSRSYGRKNNSQLMVYDPSMAQTKSVSLDGTEYTCIMLEAKTCRTMYYTVLPMTEGITVKKDGNGREVLILLESGAAIYDGDGTYDLKPGIFRTDYVWKINLPAEG